VSLDHGCLVGRYPLSERKNDAYMSPPAATKTLLRHVPLPRRLWEPACGDARGIVDPLRAHGHEVIGSDLVDYGRPDCFWRRDFLMERKMPDGCEGIVSNPPYKLAEEFIAHALDLAPLVIMLLPFRFYEAGTGRTKKAALRRYVLDEIPPAQLYVFRNRLPMMHRRNWTGRKASSAMGFAWFIWDRSHTGPTTIERISWEP
jgi:hypothetical protein